MIKILFISACCVGVFCVGYRIGFKGAFNKMYARNFEREKDIAVKEYIQSLQAIKESPVYKEQEIIEEPTVIIPRGYYER